MRISNRLLSLTRLLTTLAIALSAGRSFAQLAPEIGYVQPAGGRAGETVEVILGGYDWSPDTQIFVHDPRIRIEMLGTPSPVLVPEPPYWFGAKGRGPAWPLPREFRARLTIPADVPPGLIRWQVANANGPSPPGTLHVGTMPEVNDNPQGGLQSLPSLPVTIAGQIRRIEEVDRFELRAPFDGPITVELLARRLGSPLHGMIQVRDAQGRTLLDVADTEGRDLTTSFVARAEQSYTLSLHDLDFAGDRSYVYRLLLSPGPHVAACFPSAAKRGETRKVEFVGLGIATGGAQWERVTRDVAFAKDTEATTFSYVLETPFGKSPAVAFSLSDRTELVEAVGAKQTTLAEIPCGVTGTLDSRFGSDEYSVTLKKDERWRVTAQSRGSLPMDLELSVLGPDGKQVATQDDVAGSTDAQVALTAAADGAHRIIVADRSGNSGSPATCYHLAIERQREDFTIGAPSQLAVPLGGTAKLALKLARDGGFKAPVKIALTGLPEGVTVPNELVIPADKSELSIDLASSGEAAVAAQLVRIIASTDLDGQPVTRGAGPVLVATVLKPRFKITPEGLDDVRKVHRGSTFWAPLLIERLEGYQGDIVLEMTSKQQRHRQGLSSDELTVPPGVTRIEYPIFVPEWMETTKTSRMILNGTAKVADPRGNVRTVVQRMELRLGILPQGALLKIAHGGEEFAAAPGGELRIPLTLTRVAEFREPVRVELVTDPAQPVPFTAEPLELSADRSDVELVVRMSPDARPVGNYTLTIRATAQRDQRGRVMSETAVPVRVGK